MNGVIGMTELILDTPLTESQREFANTIRTSADSLLSLINDILDFSKIEAGKLYLENVEFDMVEVVEDAVDLFVHRAEVKGLRLGCRVDPNLPKLSGDPTRVRQIINNLVGNSLKFTQHGSIFIDVSQRSVKDGESQVLITVEDTGIGIAPERLESIFASFTQEDGSTTRKYGGTGLGLSICRQLASLMDGQVFAESVVNEGSKFHVCLSLSVAENVSLPSEEILSGKSVLMVQAGAGASEALPEYLSSWNCQLELIGDITSAKGRVAQEQTPDVVVIDLPEAPEDAISLAKQLRGNPLSSDVHLCLVSTLTSS